MIVVKAFIVFVFSAIVFGTVAIVASMTMHDDGKQTGIVTSVANALAWMLSILTAVFYIRLHRNRNRLS